ncbi:MAG: rhodanese-like domain-containing protein [Saprospiraceae bacterium]
MQKLLFLLLITTWACTQAVPAQSVLDATKTEAMLKADPSVQLIDLRTPGEVKQTGKIAGALEINFKSADFQAQVGKLDKSKPVVVYCAAGGRSARAAAQMTEMGFKNVYDYTGGMNDWEDQGKKTVPGSAGQ